VSEAVERREPLPITVNLAASALAIRATLIALIWVPMLAGSLPAGTGSRAWAWDQLVWAAVFGLLAYDLWSRGSQAWNWAVAGLALRILSWLAWAGFDHHEHPATWSAGAWFGWRTAETWAWMIGPLVLLLLPSSRRALAASREDAAPAGAKAQLPIVVQIAASALTIRAVFVLIELPAQVSSWQGIDIAANILRMVAMVGVAIVLARLARGLWRGEAGARKWAGRLLALLLAGYVGWAFYFQHAMPGHLTYGDWFGWNAVRREVWIYGPLVLLLLPSSRRALAGPG
jgi:hypothetical protein